MAFSLSSVGGLCQSICLLAWMLRHLLEGFAPTELPLYSSSEGLAVKWDFFCFVLKSTCGNLWLFGELILVDRPWINLAGKD